MTERTFSPAEQAREELRQWALQARNVAGLAANAATEAVAAHRPPEELVELFARKLAAARMAEAVQAEADRAARAGDLTPVGVFAAMAARSTAANAAANGRN